MRQEAQLLMDCIADMVLHEGMDAMRKMVAGSIWLWPRSRPHCVRGHLPDELGGGAPRSLSPLSPAPLRQASRSCIHTGVLYTAHGQGSSHLLQLWAPCAVSA